MSTLKIFHSKKVLLKENGFSLVDLIIGIVIIGVVVSSFMIAFRQMTINSRVAIERNKAIYLAQQKIEELKSYDGTGTWPPTVSDTNFSPAETGNATVYTYNITANTIPTSSNLREYVVNVSWNNNSIQLSIFIYL